MHLRALIDGQAHHMEHIVKSLNEAPETAEFADAEEGDEPEQAEVQSKEKDQSFVAWVVWAQYHRREPALDSRIAWTVRKPPKQRSPDSSAMPPVNVCRN